jgi:hypothetical protein
LIIINVGAFRFSLAFGATAVIDNRITIYPGDKWEMNEYNFTTVTINVVSSALGGTAAVQEFST